MNIIERAFELAAESGSVEEVKRKLADEGYLQVHAHLAGKQIRHEVLDRLNPRLVAYRRIGSSPDQPDLPRRRVKSSQPS